MFIQLALFQSTLYLLAEYFALHTVMGYMHKRRRGGGRGLQPPLVVEKSATFGQFSCRNNRKFEQVL